MNNESTHPHADKQGRSGDDALANAFVDEAPKAVQPVLQSMAADPRPHELSGLDESLAQYRATFITASPRARWRRRVAPMVGAAVLFALGGTAAAAYTGALPDGLQSVAHQVIGAPAAPTRTVLPREDPTPSGTPTATTSASGSASVLTPVGPDASGPAAYGLCTAWTAHQANGTTPDENSVAFKNLATAAGGADKIAAYCTTVLEAKTGESGKPSTLPTQATEHPNGKPTAMPTQANTDHANGKPSTLPTKKTTG